MKQILTVILFLLCSYNEGLAQTSAFNYGTIEYSTMGSDDWSQQIPSEMGQYRIRMNIEVTGQKPRLKHYSLHFSMMAASKAYWDDELIGENGIIGTSASTETPGSIYTSFLIPDDLVTPGNHVIEIHTSNYHANGKVRLYAMYVADHIAPLRQSIRATVLMHIYAGCFLIIGLFFLARYWNTPSNKHLLVFSLLCITFFSLVLLEFIRTYASYDYSWHFPRLQVILGLTIVISALLPLFFAIRLHMKKYLIHGVVLMSVIYLISILLVDKGYDFSTYISMTSGLILSSIICGYAYYQKKKGSRYALLSILPLTLGICLFIYQYDFILYIGFAFLVLVILISLANEEKHLVELKEEALLRSSRLEVELLKKNIQPHFLMNSITSAISWIEEKPKEGVQLLIALSEEFDILLDISSKQLIPIAKELELCRAHLKIMGYRKEQTYSLEVTGIDEYEIIPPAIFLTVLENGITHQNDGSPVSFTIDKELDGAMTTYTIISKGETSKESSGTVSYGTGFKYIIARLEESYQDRWSIDSVPITNGWKTTIRFTE